MRRQDRTDLERESPSGNPQAYGCRRYILCQLPEGETEQSQEEKRLELLEIHSGTRRKNWDWEKILDLCEKTYGTLRKEINTVSKVIFELQKAKDQGTNPRIPSDVDINDCHIAKISERWPFIFSWRSTVQHFHQLTEFDIYSSIEDFLEEYGDDLIKFFLRQKKHEVDMKKINKCYEKFSNADNKKGLKLVTILFMLSEYFDEDSSKWLARVDEGITVDTFSEKYDLTAISSTPMVFAVGKVYTAKKFYVAVDKAIETATRTFYEAFLVSFAYYYICGINYPVEASLTMDFVQRGMIGINPKKGTKTQCRKGTRPTTAVSSRLLTLFRKIHFQLQDDESEDVDMNVAEFDRLREQEADDADSS
ncbi:hypothetical protein ONE63_009559 [Megalurothrips usitatus]|uniref:Uncharacterized protein n=1 Tax=Megalurothrips usitatus TaxID=439358 RepID=A0AAV7XSI7_9NEOP|nr:hypothetical protein ONE63_009559 [Megalurothrips usitatus]